MADQVVHKQDCKERVALDLAITISHYEKARDDGLNMDREWWLKLYAQCYKSVNGWKSGEALAAG